MMVAVVATLALSGATVAFAGISETVPTDLRIRNSDPAFHGKVRTDVPACEAERRVKLFYSQNFKGFGGGRQLVGRTNSNFQGRWYVDATPLIDGAYFAKAKQHIVNINGVLVRCEPDFSRALIVGPD
jgi:hypothetical protein